MVTISVIIGVLLAFVTGFFCAVKSVQIGLRWQLQTENKQEPTITTPVSVVVDSVRQAKVDELNKYSVEQMREWMHGEQG
jgi:hypothetical protein